jgi:hypothetical protein
MNELQQTNNQEEYDDEIIIDINGYNEFEVDGTGDSEENAKERRRIYEEYKLKMIKGIPFGR